MSALVPVGVLGGNDRYNMPAAVLTAMAKQLGGDIVRDMPPFLVACTDGLAIVITIKHGGEYMGGALVLNPAQLERLDQGIVDVWQRTPKSQSVEAFFDGTAFTPTHLKAKAANVLESDWRLSFC